MITFTTEECQYILEAIREKEKISFGYAKTQPAMGLQGKFSILLQLAGEMGR
jgi:hypothetical protein